MGSLARAGNALGAKPFFAAPPNAPPVKGREPIVPNKKRPEVAVGEQYEVSMGFDTLDKPTKTIVIEAVENMSKRRLQTIAHQLVLRELVWEATPHYPVMVP